MRAGSWRCRCKSSKRSAASPILPAPSCPNSRLGTHVRETPFRNVAQRKRSADEKIRDQRRKDGLPGNERNLSEPTDRSAAAALPPAAYSAHLSPPASRGGPG